MVLIFFHSLFELSFVQRVYC